MQTTKEKKEEAKMDEQKMRQLSTPGAPHRQLARWEGSWTTRTKSWADPSMPPRESTGTSEQKMILDGHYLQDTETGDMMGGPYSGINITGYDNGSKKFVTTWISSANTSIFYAEGTASADGKTVNYESIPMSTPMGSMKFHITVSFIDDNNYRFEMFGIDKSGKENKMMETLYTRKT